MKTLALIFGMIAMLTSCTHPQKPNRCRDEWRMAWHRFIGNDI